MNITENLSDAKIRFGSFSTPYKEYRLGDITDTISRPLKMDDEKEYLLVTVKRRNEGIVERGIYKGKEVKVKSQFKLEAGDFLISKRQIIHGACEIVPSKLAGAVVSNEYHILHGKRGLLLTEYLNLLSKTPKLKNYFTLACVGVDIEKMLFRIEDWKKRVIKIPSIEEQQKIISFFELLNSKLKKQQEKIEKLEQFKKGMMQKIFSQELRFKAEDGGEFSEWESKRVADTGQVVTGNTPSKSIEAYWNDPKVPWITPTDIDDSKEISTSSSKLSDSGYQKARKVPANSLLVTCIASIGKNTILKVDGSCNQQINAIIPNDAHNVDFLYYLIEHFNHRIKSIAGTTATAIVNKTTFENLLFQIPVFEEQQKIATLLSKADEKVEKEKEKLMVLEEQKRGFMQGMFL